MAYSWNYVFMLAVTLIFSTMTIRAGRVMPGVSTPPLKFFFRNYPPLKASGYTCAQKPYPGTLFRPFRCIQVYPGVSQKKFFRPKAGTIFF